MPTYLADARYSVTVPANTSSAAAFAIKERRLGRVLVEPIFADDPQEPELYFGPLYCREMRELREMTVKDWLKNVSQKHDLPRLDSLDDLLDVKNLEELWLFLNVEEEQAEKIVNVLQAEFPDEKRLVLAAEFPLPSSATYRCADPTGKREYFLCSGSSRDCKRHFQKSVSFCENGRSLIRTKTIL
ncbi:MAG: hypothetical protein V1746_05195 [bacterium]